MEGALAAKEAIIEQLRRECDHLRGKLAEAERKYQHLSTTTAAEIVSTTLEGAGFHDLLTSCREC